jgi:hypothetical protein
MKNDAARVSQLPGGDHPAEERRVGLEQLRRAHAPSDLTLARLFKATVARRRSWIEGRLLGQPEQEPWFSAPFGTDPDWELHTAVDDDPD